MFDNIGADLKSHGYKFGSQGFWVMVVYRFGRWSYGMSSPLIFRVPLIVTYQILFKVIQVVTGVELPHHVEIGRNFVIDHFGGIIISGYAKFGDNCRIRNGVVVGLSRVEEPCAPSIGNNVDIGTGAKILGAITIGDNVLIGANAVVITNVPSNSIAVGVPATIKARRPRPLEDASE